MALSEKQIVGPKGPLQIHRCAGVQAAERGPAERLLHDIEQRLSAVTSLRLIDSPWLSTDELKCVGPILDAFRARGGRIEYKRSKQ